MKKVILLNFVTLLALIFAGCGTSEVDKNNALLANAVKAISENEVMLNDIVPFEWDILYTFAPYTSKEKIEEIIGFESSDIETTVNEGMTHLLFVQGGKVVCSICGYSENLGYGFSFGAFGEHLAVSKDDDIAFTVEESDGIRYLIMHHNA